MWALPEDELRLYLRRRRRSAAPAPPLREWIMEALDLCVRLVLAEVGLLYMNDPTMPQDESPLSVVASFGTDAEHQLRESIAQGEGLAGHAFSEEETKTWPQQHAGILSDTRSAIATPLWFERSVGGVLELRNRRGRTLFSEHDVTVIELLARYVSRAVLNAVDILKQSDLAMHDDLTGLRNNRGMQTYLDECIANAGRSRDIAVIFVDVDRLKWINDQLGHQAGSVAIRQTAEVLNSSMTAGQAFRFGGDEFVLILPGYGKDAAADFAAEVHQAIYEHTGGPLPQGGVLEPVATSMGVATLRSSLLPAGTLPPTFSTPERSRSARLLGAADRALYRAKERGRNQVAVASIQDDPIRRSEPLVEWTKETT